VIASAIWSAAAALPHCHDLDRRTGTCILSATHISRAARMHLLGSVRKQESRRLSIVPAPSAAGAGCAFGELRDPRTAPASALLC
jgi:hypothetical protein